MPAEIVAEEAGWHELQGTAVSPESTGVDAVTGHAYVGSLADGTLKELTGAGKAEVWGASGQAGRGSVARVRVDRHRRQATQVAEHQQRALAMPRVRLTQYRRGRPSWTRRP
jgi:hypothetical protein